MMRYDIRNEYDFCDPAYYAASIRTQKEVLRTDPADVNALLELGRLYEARLDLTRFISRRRVFVKYYMAFFCALSGFGMYIFCKNILFNPLTAGWMKLFTGAVIVLIAAVIGPYVARLRYPPSGKKYFKKASALDSQCGEAYMHLGLIALRRHQKRRGCELIEHALRLGVENSSIKREWITFALPLKERGIRL